MKKPYNWVCHICGATNPASSDSCQSCHFPACATGYEIAQAKGLPQNAGSADESVSQADLFERAELEYAKRSRYHEISLLVFGCALLLKMIFSWAQVNSTFPETLAAISSVAACALWRWKTRCTVCGGDTGFFSKACRECGHKFK